MLHITEPHAAPGAGALVELASFGTNPGQLKGWLYLPPDLEPGAALVVALHGCTQSAADFAAGTGWNALADRHGFAVLYPEQQKANNGNCCFNWFEPDDITRGRGEVASIYQMTAHLVETQGLDNRRVHVMGLSAGGAMANAMLAAYPEIYNSGAIVAGLPYGIASTVGEALSVMRGRHPPTAQVLAARIRTAPIRRHAPPRVSVWQGGQDHTVRRSNAADIIDQWLSLYPDLDEPQLDYPADGVTHRTWRDASGHVQLEAYDIERMGHGWPVDPEARKPLSQAAPYFLDAPVSGTARIARFFGLIDRRALALHERSAAATSPEQEEEAGGGAGGQGLGGLIRDALKAVGFTR